MPANNTRARKDKQAKIKVGESPTPVTAPQLIFKKTFQQALIDGFEKPSQFARDFLDVDPYGAQDTFLDQTRDAVEANFVAGNRVGKSWTGGVMLCWRAFYRYVSPYTAPDRITPHNIYKAVSTSMTIDQAKLAWNYALTFMTSSKRFSPFVRDYVYNPFPTIRLQTKDEKGDWVPSEIWARSLAKNGLYLLGHSINYIQPDECAYIPNYPTIEDEVIRMRLADTGGSIFRLSTPNGRNHFSIAYEAGLKQEGNIPGLGPRTFSQRVTSWENPNVSRAYLKLQKQKMAPEYYAQNVLGEFVSLSDFFKADNIVQMYADVSEEEGQADVIIPFGNGPQRGREYVLGVDLGALRDPTVCYVLDITEGKGLPKLVDVQEVQNGSWAAGRALANKMYQTYKPIYSVIDATGAGQPIYQALCEDDGWENTEGFVFSASSKPDLMTRLQDRVQRVGIKFPFNYSTSKLVNQLSFYKLDDKKLEQDHVIALALVNRAFEQARKTNTVDTVLYDDLAFVEVYSGGRAVSGATIGGNDISGPGYLFTIDPDSGFFIPTGEVEDYGIF